MSCAFGEEVEVTLYLGRDNAVSVVPYSDVVALENYDMTDVTRVTADADLTSSVSVGDAVTGDSAVDADLVYWDQITNDDGDLEWRIYCKVGLFTGIAAGEYTLRITIYDPDHPNGLVLPGTESSLIVTVVDLP